MAQLQHHRQLPLARSVVGYKAPAANVPGGLGAGRRGLGVYQPVPGHQVIELFSQRVHLGQSASGVYHGLWE